MGQRHDLSAQQADLMEFHPVRMEEQAGGNCRRQRAWAGTLVGWLSGRTQNIPGQRIQGPGIHAAALTHLRNTAQPAVAQRRISGQMLRPCPFFQRFGNIAHIGGVAGLALGNAQEHTVAGKQRHLGIGCDLHETVDQIIPQQSRGAVGLADLTVGFPVHRGAHGIAHGHAQQTALINFGGKFHTVSSFQKCSFL